MSHGATSLLVQPPAKKMGFTIESLVGSRTTPPKSASPPMIPRSIAGNRIMTGLSLENSSYRPDNGASLFARDLHNVFQRDLQDAKDKSQQLSNETFFREQLLLRQKVQELYNGNNRSSYPNINKELILREQSRLEGRDSNIENSPIRRPKLSPKSSPRLSPRTSPSSISNHPSSPHSFNDEERQNTSPIDIKKPIPDAQSPGINHLLMHGNPVFPPLPHHLMGLGATPPGSHPQHMPFPSPMVQHHLFGGSLHQGLPPGSPLGLGTPLPPVARDFPLYPWLLSRHGRVFQPGFPGKFTSCVYK